MSGSKRGGFIPKKGFQYHGFVVLQCQFEPSIVPKWRLAWHRFKETKANIDVLLCTGMHRQVQDRPRKRTSPHDQFYESPKG